MPIYDYKCETCDHEEEMILKVNDIVNKCPECKNLSFKRVFKPIPIIYKAKGFYSTDE